MTAREFAPPPHLTEDVAAIWLEVVSRFGSEQIAGPALDAYCGQIARLRDAQRRLATEGLVIQDPKGFPIPHPAIAIERAAQDEIRKWGDRFER